MKKYRVSTTISLKHYAILKKHAEKYGTHQSVIEHAVENLDYSLRKGGTPSREEELWLRMCRELGTSLSAVHIDALKLMLETVDFNQLREYIARYKPVEFTIEYIYQKPLKQCSLPELINGLVLNIKMQNMYETIDYTDEGDHYMLKLTHNLGLSASKMLLAMHESAFESYGARTESQISERSIFSKICKNDCKVGPQPDHKDNNGIMICMQAGKEDGGRRSRKVKKYRISTTISSGHYEILKKNVGKYDSQQSLLEHALESLENKTDTRPRLSMEEESWILVGKELKTSIVIIPKDITRLMVESIDIERYRDYIARTKLYEFCTEFYYQKPLKDCTLPELMDVIIRCIKLVNAYKKVSYTDEGDHYMLKMTHNWGMNYSRVQLMMLESLFESYAAKAESCISDISVFTKIYKNEHLPRAAVANDGLDARNAKPRGAID